MTAKVIIKEGVMHSICMHFGVLCFSQRALASAPVGIYPFGSRIHAHFSFLVPITMCMPYA